MSKMTLSSVGVGSFRLFGKENAGIDVGGWDVDLGTDGGCKILFWLLREKRD
jgi:hypothetical protein